MQDDDICEYLDEGYINEPTKDFMKKYYIQRLKIALDFFGIKYGNPVINASELNNKLNNVTYSKAAATADFVISKFLSTLSSDSLKKMRNIISEYKVSNIWEARLKKLGFLVKNEKNEK